MLTAKVGSSIINCFDGKYDRYRLKQWSGKGLLKCPVCDGTYEYCHGEIVQPYFRHSGSECSGYYGEPETDEHRNGKLLLYNWIKVQDGVTNCKLEAWIPETKQRPDIYFEQHGEKFVIEYQCTPIASEFLVRRELYKLAGIKDIWILGTEKYNIEDRNGTVSKTNRKFMEKEGFWHLFSSLGKLVFPSSSIKDNLPYNVITLPKYILGDLNDCYFKGDNEFLIGEKVTSEFITKDELENLKLEKIRKKKLEMKISINEIVSSLNDKFKDIYGSNFTFASENRIDYRNSRLIRHFFVNEKSISYCKTSVRSVPFTGKRGGIGWNKETYYETIEYYECEFDEHLAYSFVEQTVENLITLIKEDENRRLQNIKDKYEPIYGNYLKSEIVLISQDRDNVPDNVRFKFLKRFNISEDYMQRDFLNELNFLAKKKVSKYVFMIPKYHSYFNSLGFANYVRVSELKPAIIEHFQSFGFNNVKFINDMEE